MHCIGTWGEVDWLWGKLACIPHSKPCTTIGNKNDTDTETATNDTAAPGFQLDDAIEPTKAKKDSLATTPCKIMSILFTISSMACTIYFTGSSQNRCTIGTSNEQDTPAAKNNTAALLHLDDSQPTQAKKDLLAIAPCKIMTFLFTIMQFLYMTCSVYFTGSTLNGSTVEANNDQDTPVAKNGFTSAPSHLNYSQPVQAKQAKQDSLIAHCKIMTFIY